MTYAIALILAVAGAVLLAFPPTKIQHWYGYRTPASISSPRRWAVANKLGGYLLLTGAGLLLLCEFSGYAAYCGGASSFQVGAFLIGGMVAIEVYLLAAIDGEVA